MSVRRARFSDLFWGCVLGVVWCIGLLALLFLRPKFCCEKKARNKLKAFVYSTSPATVIAARGRARSLLLIHRPAPALSQYMHAPCLIREPCYTPDSSTWVIALAVLLAAALVGNAMCCFLFMRKKKSLPASHVRGFSHADAELGRLQ